MFSQPVGAAPPEFESANAVAPVGARQHALSRNGCVRVCGPVRSVTLYPLLLIFVFGAFALSWRRIAWLTISSRSTTRRATPAATTC